MPITWTFVLVYCFSCTVSATLSVPNFSSLDACQRYGTRVYSKLVKSHAAENVQLYECVPSK